MLSSPRSPSSTIRIFSSAENRRRVFRRMSCTTFSGVVVLLPSLPIGILLPWLRSVSYSSARRGLTDSDAKHKGASFTPRWVIVLGLLISLPSSRFIQSSQTCSPRLFVLGFGQKMHGFREPLSLAI